jgi:N-[(2S)-2-amino-2-carboxyethyl]-L-glutamate dehydrogenase
MSFSFYKWNYLIKSVWHKGDNMDQKIDFLYLNEKEMVQAGVTDMHKCVEVMEEVFVLLGTGDYVMGGKNHNAHGVLVTFPDNPQFKNMPKNGPDRRFMAMVAYLGGRFNMAGEKWYGSNKANLDKGLPRSILMVMLNDADTGAPVALMSGNLISAMRTGAIPGVGAKYLARPDSRIIALIAAGPISRCSFMSLIDVCHKLDTVKIYDIYPSASENLASFIKQEYPQIKKIEIVNSIEEAVKGADVINVATSGKVFPRIEGSWLKEGAFLSLPASVDMDPDFVINQTRKIVDNWKMYESWTDELEYPYGPVMGSIALYFEDWVKEKIMTSEQVESLGDIIAGKIPGRKNDKEIILFGQGGQPVLDVGWGFEIYQKAKEMGLGLTLNLWDKPYLY